MGGGGAGPLSPPGHAPEHFPRTPPLPKRFTGLGQHLVFQFFTSSSSAIYCHNLFKFSLTRCMSLKFKDGWEI